MSIVELVLWVVFGGIAGWLASIIVGKNSQMGLLANVLVGIVGAFIANIFLPHDANQFDFGSLIAAVIGSVVLLLLINLVMRRRSV